MARDYDYANSFCTVYASANGCCPLSSASRVAQSYAECIYMHYVTKSSQCRHDAEEAGMFPILQTRTLRFSRLSSFPEVLQVVTHLRLRPLAGCPQDRCALLPLTLVVAPD